MNLHRFSSSPARATGIAALLVSTSACRQVAPAFGPTPAGARLNGDAFFGSIAQRMTNVERAPAFHQARARLGRNAFVPSNVYNDNTVWTTIGRDSTRTLMVSAGFENGRYTFIARPNPPPIAGPADGRHFIRLRRLSESEYEWLTQVDFAVGRITADDAARVFQQLIASAEGRTAAAVRADYRTSFPRATAAFGKIFSLDTLRTSHDSEGATTTLLGIRLRPKAVQRSLPAFSRFLDKYVTPAQYRLTLLDKQGGRWLDVRGDDNLTTVLLRSRDGRLAPLNGAPRPLPDTLQMRSDFATRILFFTVGYRNLINDFYIQRSQHEIAWTMRFQKEPDWRLPPAVGRMMRTPLRRPFAQGGSVFRMTLRDTSGGQTLITRRVSGVVEESAIIRFINRLSGTMVGDFAGATEADQNRFGAEAFTALRNDLLAILR